MKPAARNAAGAARHLKDAIHHLRAFDPSLRPRAEGGQPGGLLEFPRTEEREFIVVGDLHANVRNLQALLEHEGNLSKLRRDEAVLLLLGDAVHSTHSGLERAMDATIEIMDLIISLINELPGNVIYLRGNHDSFAAELSTLGVQQGMLHREALQKARGMRYVSLMEELFEVLPLFVIHRHFLAAHAGPARGGLTRNELVNVRHFEHYSRQLAWNRLAETHEASSMNEYGPADLDGTRRLLGCPSAIPIFVGHTPAGKWGGRGSIWVDPRGCHDHVILRDSLDTECPYVSVRGSMAYTVKDALRTPTPAAATAPAPTPARRTP